MSIRMIAARALRYAGHHVPAGGEFSVKGERDARILRAVGSATPAPPPEPIPTTRPAAARRTYRRRDMVAEAAVPSSERTPEPPPVQASVSAHGASGADDAGAAGMTAALFHPAQD